MKGHQLLELFIFYVNSPASKFKDMSYNEFKHWYEKWINENHYLKYIKK